METAVSIPRPRNLFRLAALIAAIPLALIVLSFFLLLTPFYKHIDPDWVKGDSGLYTTSNQACDILIYGDSTAMVGIDPRIVSKRTHLRACNIATVGAAMALAGIEPLDHYLERNPKPRYLFLQFRPSDMHPMPDPEDKRLGFDGFLPMFRYGYIPQAIQGMLTKPDVLIGLSHYAFLEVFSAYKEQKLHPVSGVQPGAGAYTIMPKPPLTRCPEQIEFPLKQRSADWLDMLRTRYASKADTVVVDTSPTSTCNNQTAQWKTILTGHVDNTLTVYPYSNFIDFIDHPTPDMAILRSNQVSDQILALEASSKPKNF